MANENTSTTFYGETTPVDTLHISTGETDPSYGQEANHSGFTPHSGDGNAYGNSQKSHGTITEDSSGNPVYDLHDDYHSTPVQAGDGLGFPQTDAQVFPIKTDTVITAARIPKFKMPTIVVNLPGLSAAEKEHLSVQFEAVARKIYGMLNMRGIDISSYEIGVGPDVAPPELQAKTATPSTSAQTITADSGYDGLSKVVVSKVTAAIDANIVAANIKKDVVILGVTGTYEGEAEE